MGTTEFAANQSELEVAWGPHVQLVSEVRGILLGTMPFNLRSLVLTTLG